MLKNQSKNTGSDDLMGQMEKERNCSPPCKETYHKQLRKILIQ